MKPKKLIYTILLASLLIWVADSLISTIIMGEDKFIDLLILNVPIDVLYFRIFLTFLFTILATLYYNDLQKQNILKEVDVQIPGYIMNKDHEDYQILNKFFHSVRTQLNSIVGFTSLLEDEHIDEDASRLYLEYLESSKNSLQRSVDDLLKAYRENKHLGNNVKIPGLGQEVDWSTNSILIAEDNEANYLLLAHILKKTGVKISWVKNGRKAVEQFQQQDDIDLILMDIIMPEMDGIDATREIKSLNPRIPIIAQTANGHGWKDSAMYLFDEILMKPIWDVELLQKCAKYLKNSSQFSSSSEIKPFTETRVS